METVYLLIAVSMISLLSYIRIRMRVRRDMFMITSNKNPDCPECDGHVHRVIQPVGIVFKGSGFYVTDNRSRSSTALPGKKESADTEKESKPEETASEDKPSSTTD